MGEDSGTKNKNQRKFMAAARLISGVSNGRRPDDILESGVYSYDIISALLEDQGLARSISEAARVPYERIGPAARTIIEFLLWNSAGDPFIALGLTPFATAGEIHRRWKKLITLYHPDRLPGAQNEEAAKKINEAYDTAVGMKS